MLVVIGRLALRSGRRAVRVGPYSRGIIKVEVKFKRGRAGREGSKGDKAFYRCQKQQLTKQEHDT